MVMKNKYFIVVLLLSLMSLAVSCFPEYREGQNEPGESPFKGDVLRFSVTLDNMGGVTTKAEEGISIADKLERLENYVDPEKFRVLVFNHEDKFLFESKNRWVKQLDPEPTHSIWSVDIPLYSYGNDREYDGLWDEIRDQLVNHKFKIAILANRPEVDWFPEMAGGENVNNATQFDNSGPHWGPKNSIVYKGEDGAPCDVFDLHHCQFDPIYEYKGSTDFEGKTDGTVKLDGKNVYEVILDDSDKGTPEMPYLSATSSWVQFGDHDGKGNRIAMIGGKEVASDTIRETIDVSSFGNLDYKLNPEFEGTRDSRGWNFRKTRLPSEDYPIPMYGIQEFAPISGWKKGTTMRLNRVEKEDKPISLLRSVVKLELIIPINAVPTDVVLFYSNIYARCEPMDVWTPTDQIWYGDNNNHNHNGYCDIDRLKNIEPADSLKGRMTKFDDPGFEDNSYAASYNLYQQRIAWLYGIWWKAEKWKKFDQYSHIKLDKAADYPRVFNPCMQRNNMVYVEKTYEDIQGAHYIVYTGERNINDPSNLARVGNRGDGNPTVLYWCLVYDNENKTHYLGDGEGAKTYSFPIVDYNNPLTNKGTGNNTIYKQGQINLHTTSSGGKRNWYIRPDNDPTGTNGTGMGNYLRRVQGQKDLKDSQGGGTACEDYDYPLPLIRNHIYRLTLSTLSTTKSGEDLSFTPRLEEMHTPDICFKK